MAKYTREEYEAGLEKAKAAQDKGAINYFQGKLKDLDVEDNTEKLFRAKSKAMAANDDGAVEYFNKRIEKETKYGDTGLKGSDLIFDKLINYQGYRDALTSYYSKEENRPTFGNVDDMYDDAGNFIGNEDDLNKLKEKNFEYWNGTTLNLLQMGNTALELSRMSDEEKDVAKTLYETYEKTKITGEGSRSGFQQMKDAWHILYDPTTWMGGKFLMGPAQKAATRKGIMLALSKGKDKAVLKSQPEKLAVARKLKEAENIRKYAGDDIAKTIAAQQAIKDRAKFSLKKKLLQDGLSQQEANAVLKATAKSTARRSSGVGAAYTGVYDAALQTGVQNQLDPDREFSLTQNLAATGLGAGFGYATPAAGRFASWALQKPGSMVQNALPKIKDTLSDPLGVIRDPIVRSLGGKKAARTGVAEEAESKFRLSENNKGSAEAAEDAFANLTEGVKEGKASFKRQYEELGEFTDQGLKNPNILRTPFAVRSKTKKFNQKKRKWEEILEDPKDTFLVKQLQAVRNSINDPDSVDSSSVPISSLDKILDKINKGTMTPTQGLRKFRSEIGTQSNKANMEKSVDAFNLQTANKRIKDLFNVAAKRAGKGEEAAKIDSLYGQFANTLNDKKVSSMLQKVSDTQRQMKSAISAGNSSLIREHLNNVKKLAKFSDTPAAFMEAHRKALRDISNEIMFSGQTATTFKRYLSNTDGQNILKQIYPKLKKDIDRLATIQRNSEAGGTVGMFAMRLMTTAVASIYGFGVGGPLGSAIVGGSGYIVVEKMLASKAFQRMSMKTFTKEPTKNPSQLLATSRWFQKRFPKLTPDEVNKMGNIIFGGSLWAYVLANTDDLNGKIRGGIKFTGDTGKDVIDFLTQESTRADTSENLDKVAQQLGVTDLPGFRDNAFSNFQQDPSLITR